MNNTYEMEFRPNATRAAIYVLAALVPGLSVEAIHAAVAKSNEMWMKKTEVA